MRRLIEEPIYLQQETLRSNTAHITLHISVDN